MTSFSKNARPDCIDALVRADVISMDAYRVVPAEGMLKLDAMENPYPLPVELKQPWLDRLSKIEVNRYPDSRSESLKRMLRTTFLIADTDGLLLGNGSDELIQMITLLVGGHRRTILAPTPTFSMYQVIATVTGTNFVGVPLRTDFSLSGDILLSTIRDTQPSCVFLAYPNNPTGNCFAEEIIEQVLECAPGLVVLDEAYFGFCHRSFISRLASYPNLLVLRTLSKNGMAGLRLGMLIGNPHWIAQLEKVRLPYNINSLTQCSAEFYLEHYHEINRQSKQIIAARQTLAKQLADQPGLISYPSEANFILFRVESGSQRVYEFLKAHNILLKNLHCAETPLENCLRVTVGTQSENAKFLEVLRAGMS